MLLRFGNQLKLMIQVTFVTFQTCSIDLIDLIFKKSSGICSILENWQHCTWVPEKTAVSITKLGINYRWADRDETVTRYWIRYSRCCGSWTNQVSHFRALRWCLAAGSDSGGPSRNNPSDNLSEECFVSQNEHADQNLCLTAVLWQKRQQQRQRPFIRQWTAMIPFRRAKSADNSLPESWRRTLLRCPPISVHLNCSHP